MTIPITHSKVDRDTWLDETLAQLDWIIEESSDAWEASKRGVSGANASFLNQIQMAIKQRRALIGLDMPTKIAPTSPDGQLSFDFNIIRTVIAHQDGTETDV